MNFITIKYTLKIIERKDIIEKWSSFLKHFLNFNDSILWPPPLYIITNDTILGEQWVRQLFTLPHLLHVLLFSLSHLDSIVCLSESLTRITHPCPALQLTKWHRSACSTLTSNQLNGVGENHTMRMTGLILNSWPLTPGGPGCSQHCPS